MKEDAMRKIQHRAGTVLGGVPATRSRPLAALLALVVALWTATGAKAATRDAGPPDTSVAQWDSVGSQAFTAAGLSPAEGHLIFGYVSIAMYDSVVAIRGRYEPFAIQVDAPRRASAEAAVAGAAHRVLSHYLPQQKAAILDPALKASLVTIPDGKAKARGVAVGQHVADRFVAARADDGLRAPVTYTPPIPPIPGVWIPTAPTLRSGPTRDG
jgi:hypothetical protein